MGTVPTCPQQRLIIIILLNLIKIKLKVGIWDCETRKFVAELNFSSEVRRVRLTKVRTYLFGQIYFRRKQFLGLTEISLKKQDCTVQKAKSIFCFYML